MTEQTEPEINPSQIPTEQLRVAKQLLEVLTSMLPKPLALEELVQARHEQAEEDERTRQHDAEAQKQREAHLTLQKEAARKHDISLELAARQATALERIANTLERIASKAR